VTGGTGAAQAAGGELKPPKYPLVLGKPIRHRREQQLAWVGGSILLGAGLIAGFYWIFLQQDYRNLGLPWGSAKAWWDGGMGIFHTPDWAAYRHGIRDNGEPETWTIIGAALLGKTPKRTWLFPRWAFGLALTVLFAVIIGCAAGLTWLTAFGPLGHGGFLVLKQLILGMIAGRIIHYAWAPFGASIRYYIVASSASNAGPAPLWVRYPLMPPTWREQWSVTRARATAASDGEQERPSLALKILIPSWVALAVLIAIVGLLAKYPVANGIHIPVMNP
jgi:hypothetical protein